VLSQVRPRKFDASGATDDEDVSRSPHGATEKDGPWFAVEGSTNRLQGLVNQRVEITGTLTTEGSVIGTSASVTDGPSGTIEVTTVKALQETCGPR
jgi:hypothetical protein